jgi:hypothetical protein
LGDGRRLRGLVSSHCLPGHLLACPFDCTCRQHTAHTNIFERNNDKFEGNVLFGGYGGGGVPGDIFMESTEEDHCYHSSEKDDDDG